VKFAFIAVEKAHYPVDVLCDVLEVSRSGYYAWTKREVPARAKADAHLAVTIAAVHRKSRSTYGSPRIHAELRARGVHVGKKRIERLMRTKGLRARQKRRFRRTTDAQHTRPIAPNLLERQFEAKTLNEAWVTDVTYIPTDEAGSTWRRSSTCARDVSSAGRQAPPTIAPWRSMRSRARCARVVLCEGWCTTRTAAAPTPARTTARSCAHTALSPA
jgi:transposase InsO family protein